MAVTVVVGAKAASVFEPKIAKERMPKASLMIIRASLNVPPHCTMQTAIRETNCQKEDEGGAPITPAF